MIKFLYSRQAQKDIKRIDKTEAKKILLSIQEWEKGIKKMPIPKTLISIKPLQHRVRIGNYRIRGYLNDSISKVLRIRHRSDIYKDL